MPIREIRSKIGLVQCLNPAIITAGTAQSAAIDTLGYDGVMFALLFGAIVASGLITVTLQEGSLANGSDLAAIALADFAPDANGSAPAANPITVFTASSVQRYGYRGSKRYVGILATYVSGTSVAFGGAVVLGYPHQMPIP